MTYIIEQSQSCDKGLQPERHDTSAIKDISDKYINDEGNEMPEDDSSQSQAGDTRKEPKEDDLSKKQAGDESRKENKFTNVKKPMFFEKGRCKFGRECKFAHPNICKNLIKFGLLKFNTDRKGCDENCH